MTQHTEFTVLEVLCSPWFQGYDAHKKFCDYMKTYIDTFSTGMVLWY